MAAALVWLSFYFFSPSLLDKRTAENLVKSTNNKLIALNTKLSENGIDPKNLTFDVEPLVSLAKAKEERDKIIGDPVNQEFNSNNAFFQLVINYNDPKNCKSDNQFCVKIPILKISPAMVDTFQGVKYLSANGYWPIRKVNFETGAYTASALLAESSTKDLSSSDVERIRKLIDKQLSDIPSPTMTTLSVGRRLVGDIQLLCYFLFYYGLLLIVFSYAATVLPNALLRSRSSNKVQGMCVDRIPDNEKANRYWWKMRLSNEPQAQAQDIIQEDYIPSPWLSNSAVQATSHDFELFYSKLGNEFSRRIGLGLLDPVVPLTELRRIGYMALQSSPTAENVPNFIAVESDGLSETLEAKNKITQFIIWAIPTIGFVGTVLGIGDALSSTVDMQSNVLSVRAAAESQVGSNIGLAFDTTFVALVLSFFLMLAYFLLQKSQELLISQEKRSTLFEIIQPENLVQSMSSSQLQELIRIMKEQVNEAQENRVMLSLNNTSEPNSRRTSGWAVVLILVIVLLTIAALLYFIYPSLFTTVINQAKAYINL